MARQSSTPHHRNISKNLKKKKSSGLNFENKPISKEACKSLRPRRGDSHIERAGCSSGNFNSTPKKYQSGVV